VKKLKKAVPQYDHAAGVIIKQEKVLLAQRPSAGLLGGMWEFPNGRVNQNPAQELAKVLKAGYNLQLGAKRKVQELGKFQHAYTHFKVTVHAFICALISIPKAKNLKWVALHDLADYPMGKIDRQIADTIMQRNRT
jgi:A/G-specific adenine glycosylase